MHATGALKLLLDANEELQVELARAGIIDRLVRLIRTGKGNHTVKSHVSFLTPCVWVGVF